ncbi:nucleoside hydrolase [Actinopolymorpha alba]|nr:nucleoside hydrolase [Actinopolymorpha alba]
MAVPLILDRDPGHDNAIAILFAAANPAVDLLAITTVANRHPPGAGHA